MRIFQLILLVFALLPLEVVGANDELDQRICSELEAEDEIEIDITNPQIFRNWLQDSVNHLIEDRFPELLGKNVTVEPVIQSSEYFFSANTDIGVLFQNRSHRRYCVNYNPDIVNRFPGRQAVEGILIHELQHLVDIENRSTVRVLLNAARNALSVNQYERGTDRRAIERGAREGLIRYRCWQYSFLTEKQLRKKKRRYLTPSEMAN